MIADLCLDNVSLRLKVTFATLFVSCDISPKFMDTFSPAGTTNIRMLQMTQSALIMRISIIPDVCCSFVYKIKLGCYLWAIARCGWLKIKEFYGII